MKNLGSGHRAVSRVMMLALAVGFAVVGIAGAASAHQGNIRVSSAVCVDTDTMTATYTVGWQNGTNSGVLSQKPGLLNSNSPWTFVKNITGSAGSTTFQITHEKSSFTGGNGPWQSARIVFSDNYKIEYDTRVEGFDWSKCLTPIDVPAKPAVTDPCGPGNAAYLPQTDTSQVDWTLNSDGSLNVRPQPGYTFRGASQSVTYPVPTDSNVPCPPTKINVPTVPVVDDCGPGNAHYGTVPAGQWTSVVNPDGSLTITANPGYAFPNGQTAVTLPAPADSNVACPVVTPPVVTPPVVTPPEVLPAEVRVVRPDAKFMDKCGRASDMFKVAQRRGVVYKVGGKVLRQGTWIKATSRSVTIRAFAADASYALKGKQVWRVSFTRKTCAKAPEVAPSTGS